MSKKFYSYEKKGDGLVFAKIVYGSYVEDRDPFWNAYKGVLTVSGYNQNEIEKVVINSEYRDDLSDRDKSHQIINLLFWNYGNQVFKNLSNYNHLYYGHTKEKGDFF